MFKETLIGIVMMAVCWLLYVFYIRFQQLCDEDSKRGEIARFIDKIGSGLFWIYIAFCNIAGLIIGLLFIFT